MLSRSSHVTDSTSRVANPSAMSDSRRISTVRRSSSVRRSNRTAIKSTPIRWAERSASGRLSSVSTRRKCPGGRWLVNRRMTGPLIDAFVFRHVLCIESHRGLQLASRRRSHAHGSECSPAPKRAVNKLTIAAGAAALTWCDLLHHGDPNSPSSEVGQFITSHGIVPAADGRGATAYT